MNTIPALVIASAIMLALMLFEDKLPIPPEQNVQALSLSRHE